MSARRRPSRDWDESDVHIRPGKGSRPRTKDRPSHKNAQWGMVITKDRGRWGVVLDDAPDDARTIVCMRARELGRTAIVVGDRVGVVGDTSGNPGTLARIVKLADRRSILRRTADDNDPYERIVVANADQLLIVSSVADPPPRAGFVERALVAAFAGGISPILCLTKSDLTDPAPFAHEFEDLDIRIVIAGQDDDITDVRRLTRGHVTALIGHSGVGKSTLVNRLVPDADRATGEVSGVGKGKHTSTQSVALRLPTGTEHATEDEPADAGWIIDTPGIRSFGLAHVDPDTVIAAFEDLAELITDCPRGCTHMGPPADPECALDTATGATARRVHAIRSVLETLRSNDEWDLNRDDS
ncbi:ribosome small subunit-dependent GTPase A [Corynebacterium sp. MC-04]|uniref:Ribosome small subunit-dependent GTPase A n=1 Tax=Corynebacterium parakroppenstedtii TaxID=2828363 RepID=A0ABS9HGL6_9CORY|nr:MULTISPECIES: ribosome small subunit-dependent GTPase A [Corynebacterium]MDU3197233.1 ribosome small subunit-dependent GTPase A [Corynebacterium kroppenstedtii]MBY0788206.1 ribosome small subunit-dependent GTPase A [Corynebacterium parakroppenstedtii]MBY0792282.1 ribosome small subunit-dependent GTPase A [Corynebacterium parakroppenstedtii]MBY0793759.1 ribosome small subunit-dependent GTPase A [Corynebacterium parakroppenstedtii]MCF6769232.1 ribosome small subunit-dependent GTPase A [Coryne